MKTNISIAALIIVLLSLWMTFGSSKAGNAESETVTTIEAESKVPQVRIRVSNAKTQTETITLRGKTKAARHSLLKAEIAGRIVEVAHARGSTVSAGETLIRIDVNDLPEQKEAAIASLKQRELEFEAAKRLEKGGFQSETRSAEAAFLLKQASAQLAQIEQALKYTEIKAPYDGVFNERLVEVGGYVAPGDPIADFLQLSPMIIEADATEREVRKIGIGHPATAVIDDHEVSGKIRYVSRSADDATRTFKVEFEFPNADSHFSSGFTADIRIPIKQSKAHFVSPSLLYLSANTKGELGLKTVDDNDTVVFHRTEILSGERDGVWVSGLPDKVRLIVVGQGFVKPGSQVDPVDEATIQN